MTWLFPSLPRRHDQLRETHYGMRGKALWNCSGLSMECYGKGPKTGGSEVVWEGTSTGKQRDRGIKGLVLLFLGDRALFYMHMHVYKEH